MQVVIEDSQPVDGPPSDVGAARPSWLQLVAAVVALGFLAGAGVYWWQQPEAEPGRVDIGFYDDMSTHHLQGIQMGFTYLEGGSDPVLLHMAREIVLWQSGELRLMQQALQDWGEEGTPEQAMEWMGMSPVPQDAQPGMATPQETVSLERATGRELDDLLSRLMIDHHAWGASTWPRPPRSTPASMTCVSWRMPWRAPNEPRSTSSTSGDRPWGSKRTSLTRPELAGSTSSGPTYVRRHPAGQRRGLPDPTRQELLVELVVFVDVEVARVLVLGLAGGTGRRDVPRKKVTFTYSVKQWKAEEPALALDAVERRVPFDRLAHAGDGAHDERVEAAPDVALPARHGRDVGLHGASPSPFAICGLPPARRTGFLPSPADPLGLALLGVRRDGGGDFLEGRDATASELGGVQGCGGSDEGLEGLLIDLVSLIEVNGAPHVAFEAGVEETSWILQRGALGEGELHLVL